MEYLTKLTSVKKKVKIEKHYETNNSFTDGNMENF